MLLPTGVHADDESIMAKLAGHSMLLDGDSRDGLMVVVGERGHVLISSDGNQWKQIAVPTRATLTGVYFQDKMNGWVVGHDAVILRTTDGGKLWQKSYYDRIIRNERELDNVRRYIKNNPLNWENDRNKTDEVDL